jgi:hypothetical protein
MEGEDLREDREEWKRLCHKITHPGRNVNT